ncbi:hypothetical protein ACFU6M_12125 [Streptomyces bottropensis]|uniref:Fe2OG dioxygenase domain-containing protein n=1 Tax=Streptomyces bottropensis TaxID=42235 RepID=A0ABU8AXR9_9ACTN
MADMDDLIDRHLRWQLEHASSALRKSYEESDYAEITDFMPDCVHRLVLDELESMFLSQAKRRDLIIRQSGNTPRKFSNLDRDTLRAGSRVLPSIFRSDALISLLEQIVGSPVHRVPYVPEEYIAARLHKAGDVHGWHWDDYTWALVWIFKMPDAENGGSVEYIKRVPWNRDDPRVGELVEAGPVIRRHPKVGSAYLLKADTALHRVAPLTYDAERMMICFTFAGEDDLTREVTHESMEALFSASDAR